MGGALVGICLVLWLVRRSSNHGGGQQVADSRLARVERAARLCALAWVVMLSAALIAVVSGSTAAMLVIAVLLLTVMQPALWARLAMARGWVAPAYWLGRSALWVNQGSLHGGALFYAWCAAQHWHHDPVRYPPAMAFVRKRLQSSAQPSDSGVLLMQVLLEQDTLLAPRFYRRLLMTRYLDMRCIPSAMRAAAFRLTAAHALAIADWENLVSAAQYWRSQGRIPLADVLMTHYLEKGGKHPWHNRAARLPWRPRRPTWTGQLPALANGAVPVGVDVLDQSQLHACTWALGAAGPPAALGDAWQAALHSPAAQQHWQQRAVALGCNNPQQALAALGKSLADWQQAHAGGGDGNGNDEYRDHLFQMLRFKTQAINNRLGHRALLGGRLEYEEFLGLIEVFEQLSDDPVQQHQAYALFESTVWNWMAELWNDAKERWLAYAICSRLHGYADSVGSPAARVYQQILRGEVR